MQPTILVLEDDFSLCEILELLFTQEGWGPIITRNCSEAHDALRTGGHISLVIVDFLLRGETCEEFVRSIPEGTPLILFTACGSAENLGKAMQANEIIKKPCDLDYLLTTVRLFLLPR